MTLQQQEELTKSEGTKWLSNGELNLMLSIFLCNGRYEDAAYILPTTDGQALRLGIARCERCTNEVAVSLW
jgi:hypothetical protein